MPAQFTQWRQPRNPTTPSNPQRGRGGRGRGRGRGQGRQGLPTRQVAIAGRSGGSNIVRDTEILGNTTKTLGVYMFNPSPDALVRLKQFEKMYSRFRIKYVNISYKPLCGTTEDSSVAVGVLVGKQQAGVVDIASIQKCKPSFTIPSWKAESLSVGNQIDSQRYLYCGETDDNGVSFTLYVMATAANKGCIQVSYEVEFAYPRPF